jgi:hypothetical protein
MGFLPQTMAPESKDFKLFKDMWDLLEGEKNGGVSMENLLYLMLLIRGAKLPRREVAFDLVDIERNDLFKTAKIGEKGQLLVCSGGQDKIFVHFKDFYVNRLQFEGLRKTVKKVKIELTSTPKYTKTS